MLHPTSYPPSCQRCAASEINAPKLLIPLPLNRISETEGEGCIDDSLSFLFQQLGSEVGRDREQIDSELKGWSPVAGPVGAPSARGYATAIVFENNIFTFGGSAGSSRKNDMQRFDLTLREWVHVDTSGAQPSPRNSHSAVVYKNRMIVFGGWDGGRNCNDVYQYNLQTSIWTQLQPGGMAPKCRRGHSSVICGNAMYMFGGWDGGRNFADFHKLVLGDDSEISWEVVQSNVGQVPSGRRGHASVEFEGGLYIFGGQDGSSFYSDVFHFNPEPASWSLLHCSGPHPSARSYHTAVVFHNCMHVFGGTGANWCFYNDLHMLNFSTCTWSQVQYSGSTPSPRCFHTSVVANSSLFVFGGARLTRDTWEYFNHLYRFSLGLPDQDPEKDNSTLSSDLKELLGNEEYSDLTFVVQGRSIHAHKAVLCARSEYFRRMLQSGMVESRQSEIVVQDIRYKVFHSLLEYIYTDDVDIAPDVAVELMSVASRYGMDTLKTIMEKRIMRSITVENVSLLIVAADLHHAVELKRVCLDFMLKEFGRVMVQDSFVILVSQHTVLAKQVLTHASSQLNFCFR